MSGSLQQVMDVYGLCLIRLVLTRVVSVQAEPFTSQQVLTCKIYLLPKPRGTRCTECGNASFLHRVAFFSLPISAKPKRASSRASRKTKRSSKRGKTQRGTRTAGQQAKSL